MQESHGALAAGQRVVVRDERWIVLGADTFDRVRLVSLRGVDDDNRDCVQQLLTPFDDIAPLRHRTSLRQRTRRTVLRKACSGIHAALRWDECWTARTARIELH